MRNDNYIVIQGWMRNELDLKGNELLIYALIYGFSQDGQSEFAWSMKYIAEWTGATKQTIHNVLKSLIDKKLIEKRVEEINNVRFCTYKIILPVVKNFDGGGKKILPGEVKNFDGGGKKIAPHINTFINTSNNNINNKGVRFTPPTVDEVRAYCSERGNGLDAQHFVDYYASQKWKKANGQPVADWKACVRTWERQDKEQPKNAFHNFEQRDGVDYDDIERRLQDINP